MDENKERVAMMRSSHIKRVPYVRIGVSNLKRSASFFQDILGLEKISEWPAGAIFDIAGVELGVELKAKPEICLFVDDVDKAYQDLKDKGVGFVTEPKDQPWGGRTATFADPDGNEFTIESFKCKVCGKACQSYRELLEEHLRKHRS
jgi:catechol 2,3-dioxygenase-like lactoylglutathione lyase family enzyme